MRLDLYQAECEHVARLQAALLEQARTGLLRPDEPRLSPLEQAGMLHALQVSIENAIGKAKHWLKALGQEVPVSAYDSFAALSLAGVIDAAALAQWNAAVGLRNRIVHDYMNVDLALIQDLVRKQQYRFILEVLRRPIEVEPQPRPPK